MELGIVNASLKKVQAEQMMDHTMLKDVAPQRCSGPERSEKLKLI